MHFHCLRWRPWPQHCFLNFMLRVVTYSLNLYSNALIVVTIFILYPPCSTWFCRFHTASKVRAICSELCSCSSFDERLVLFTLASGSITNFAMSLLYVIKIRSKMQTPVTSKLYCSSNMAFDELADTRFRVFMTHSATRINLNYSLLSWINYFYSLSSIKLMFNC